MKKIFLILALSIVGQFIFPSRNVFSSTTYIYSAYATVAAPTQVSLEIWFWRSSRTLPSPDINKANPLVANGTRVISADPYYLDFGAGVPVGTRLPGRTSWDDTRGDKPAPKDDGFLSRDGNVGFTAHCLGPLSSTFKISCGRMTDGAGHEIPYSIQYSPDPTNPGAIKTLNCFGFTCSLDDEGDRYIIGRKNSMKLHSSDGTSYTLPANEGYGHDFLIYNLLYIPATTYPGVYQTTGNPGYEHLMVSWY